MEFNYAYKGHSSVDNRADRTALSFTPDGKRKPTFFRGELDRGLAFRESHQRATRCRSFRSTLQT